MQIRGLQSKINAGTGAYRAIRWSHCGQVKKHSRTSQVIRTHAFRMSAQGSSSHTSTFFDTFEALATELDGIETQLPPLTDPSGLEPLEHLSYVNPHIASAHLSYHGAVIILYSLSLGVSESNGDDNTRQPASSRSRLKVQTLYEKVFASATKLAELGKRMRGQKGLTEMQCLLESVVSCVPHPLAGI